MSQTMRCRPATLLGVDNPLTAFYVDRATYTLCTHIEGEMDRAEKRLPDSAKAPAITRARQRVLDRYLGTESIEYRNVGG